MGFSDSTLENGHRGRYGRSGNPDRLSLTHLARLVLDDVLLLEHPLLRDHGDVSDDLPLSDDGLLGNGLNDRNVLPHLDGRGRRLGQSLVHKSLFQMSSGWTIGR